MRVLITGSTGFIGRSLGRFAILSGHEVLGLSRAARPSVDWSGRYLHMDVAQTDLSPVVRDFAPHVIVHAAGTASVAASLEDPLKDFRTAIVTWINTLDSVRRAGIQPVVIFPSSAAVYGNPDLLPVREDCPMRPISPYGFHKVASEFLAQEFAQCFGLDILICRFFSVFGPAQRRGLIWEIYKQCVGPEPVVWLQGTGKEARDFVHIDDLASALFLLIEQRLQAQHGSRCLTLNIASGEATEVLPLADQLRDLIASTKSLQCHGLEREGDPDRWSADISLFTSLAPRWEPKPLALRLRQCVAAWQKEQDFLS